MTLVIFDLIFGLMAGELAFALVARHFVPVVFGLLLLTLVELFLSLNRKPI